MVKTDSRKVYERTISKDDNAFKVGDFVEITKLCDTEGNELETKDNRYEDLFNEGVINFVMSNDSNGGYVYGIDGCKYCFNKFELKRI